MNITIIRILTQFLIFIWVCVVVLLIGFILGQGWIVNLLIPFIPLYTLFNFLDYDDKNYWTVDTNEAIIV